MRKRVGRPLLVHKLAPAQDSFDEKITPHPFSVHLKHRKPFECPLACSKEAIYLSNQLCRRFPPVDAEVLPYAHDALRVAPPSQCWGLAHPSGMRMVWFRKFASAICSVRTNAKSFTLGTIGLVISSPATATCTSVIRWRR